MHGSARKSPAGEHDAALKIRARLRRLFAFDRREVESRGERCEVVAIVAAATPVGWIAAVEAEMADVLKARLRVGGFPRRHCSS